MNIDDVKNRLRPHGTKILLGCTSVLLAVSAVSFGANAFGGDTQASDEEVAQKVEQLQGELDTAQSELQTTHDKLLADLPGADVERAQRDRASGRAVLLNLTSTSSSSRDVLGEQRRLDAQYTVFDNHSRTLTEFVPQWMAATDGTDGHGTMFRLQELDIQVSGVQGLTYSYVGLARLDPVTLEDTTEAKSQFVLFTYSTQQDGTMIDFQAYQTSGRSRDDLVLGAGEQTDTETPSASPTPSDGG